MKKKTIYLIIAMFLAMPLLDSCGSRRSCKTKKYKKSMYAKQCWNAKKQKYTRCR